MKKRKLTNMPSSVHHRLLNLARETKRIGASEHADRFVLKGALMLRVWSLPLARPTMDIDMLGRTPKSVDDLVEIIRQCLAVEIPDDGVSFDTKSVKGEAITLDKKYHGVRLRVYGRLGNAHLSLQFVIGTR